LRQRQVDCPAFFRFFVCHEWRSLAVPPRWNPGLENREIRGTHVLGQVEVLR